MGHDRRGVSGLALALALALSSGCACGSVTGTPLGTPCARASDCTTGHVCSFGSCRSSCATSRDCSAGSTCLRDAAGGGACSLASEVGCTSPGHACSAGLVCVADRCAQTCTISADCPTDLACVAQPTGSAACMASGATDAGTTDTGSAIDAATDASVDARTDDAGVLAGAVVSGCVGTSAACVVAADHTVYCWGDGANGALGDGRACTTTGATRAPTRVPGLTGVDVVACGDGFACAHASDGHVQCWGRNDLGQLGRGTTTACEATPAPVVDGTATPLSIATADVVAAGAHACALTLGSGALQCWGRNDGLIDVRASSDRAAVYASATDALGPLRDAAGSPLPGASVTGLAIGRGGAAARVIVSRDLYLWGDNDHLETASSPGPQHAAVRSPGAGRGTSASAGRLHRCALDAGGVICWGDDGVGQLGHAPGASAIACGSSMCEPPGTATGSFVSIATSGDGDTTCGIADASAVRCWGDNAHGLAGVPASTRAIAYLDGATPAVAFPAATQLPLSRLIVGPSAACAIDASGALWCWGDHDLDPATTDRTTPSLL